MQWTVVGLNVSVNMITVISLSANQEDAEVSARFAPQRYFKHITIIKPDGEAYKP